MLRPSVGLKALIRGCLHGEESRDEPDVDDDDDVDDAADDDSDDVDGVGDADREGMESFDGEAVLPFFAILRCFSKNCVENRRMHTL